MIACSLQSGSNGNCIYVEAGGVRLLFDAASTAFRQKKNWRHGDGTSAMWTLCDISMTMAIISGMQASFKGKYGLPPVHY